VRGGVVQIEDLAFACVGILGCDFSPIVKKFKSEPQNTRLPCEKFAV
jgi:hypothetical protein